MKKRQRPFARELAEMVRYAVGYRSRAFVTFGAPIARRRSRRRSRAATCSSSRALVRARIGALYKVLPTAVFAAAMRPSITRRDLEARIDRLIEELAARHANLGVTSGRQAVEEAAEPLETRGIVVAERGRFRVRERTVLRYYARTIEHLLATPGRHADATDARSARPRPFSTSSRRSGTLKKLASRYGMRRPDQLRAPVHRRRDRRRKRSRRRARVEARGMMHDARSTSARASPTSPRRTPRRATTSRVIDADRRSPASDATSR